MGRTQQLYLGTDEKWRYDMSTLTENYNLIKPASSDNVNIQDINDNMDAIDAALFGKANSVHTHAQSDITGLTEHTHALTDDRITGTLPVSKGGTGATSTNQALKDFGFKSGEVYITVPKGETRGSEFITFDEPYADTHYVIIVSVYSGIAGGNEGRTATYTGITTSGFELRLGLNNASSAQDNSATCSWMTMPLFQDDR